MLFKKNTISLISIVLIALFLNSCTAYETRLIPLSPPPSFEGRIVHLIWEHSEEYDVYMTEASIKNNNLTGLVKILPNFNPRTKPEFFGNVYLYPSCPVPDSAGVHFSISIEQISKIEVYQKDHERGFARTVLLIAGVGIIIGFFVFASEFNPDFSYPRSTH
jgi:hypothetical protein